MPARRNPLPLARAFVRAVVAACLLACATAAIADAAPRAPATTSVPPATTSAPVPAPTTGTTTAPDAATLSEPVREALSDAAAALERAEAEVAIVGPRRRPRFGARVAPAEPVERAAAELAAPDVMRDVPYDGPGGPTLDVHRPEGGGRAAAVLVVHGGAWSGGDKVAIGHVARAIADAGMVAVNVNYTLAVPGRPGFPLQLDELRAAVRWVRRHSATIGVDPTRIGALGSSAGAHLSALLATIGRGPLTAGNRLRAVVSWSAPLQLGAVRLRGRLPTKIVGFLGCGPCRRRATLASPITHVTRDDPPMMLVNSRRELIPAVQTQRMANRLRAAGVRRRLRLLGGTMHSPRYSPTMLRPSISFLRRHLRR